MIIHIFNERVNVVKELSLTASSMYPIHVDGKIIANVISDVDSWVMKATDGYYSPEAVKDTVKLQQYHIYNIIAKKTKEVFNIVITMRYFPDAQVFAIPGRLIIGNTPACDVCLPVKNGRQESLKLELIDNGWVAETDSRNFYASRTRIVNGRKILCGDSIFYYGLKIILLHSTFILCSPKEYIKLKPYIKLAGPEPSFAPKQVEDGNYDYDTPLYGENDYYYKSPRFNYTIEEASLKIDPPPPQEKRDDMPLIVTVGPQITMASASMISIANMLLLMSSGSNDMLRIGLSIGAMAITMIGALVWPAVSRHVNKRRIEKREKKRQIKYSAYLDQKKQEIEQLKQTQKQVSVQLITLNTVNQLY